MDAARGTPVGNFPTFRGMDGSVRTDRPNRKPRMMGRQIFAYSMGFLLTGDEALLDLARAGNRWLLDHARDTVRGGWHADLDAAGQPPFLADKLAQDLSYDLMGPASYFFVTADPESEAAVLAARDLLFDPARYWDAANGRIRDGLDSTLTTEAYMGRPDSWELVAQLDPITAFLLLVQPVPRRRRPPRAGPRRSPDAGAAHADVLLEGRPLLGLHRQRSGSTPGRNHNDFGHMLKAYWAVLQIDKRLADQPHAGFLQQYAPAALTLAHDAGNGRWAKYPTSPTTVQYGSDWWSYAESDQLAATLALHDPAWIPVLGETARHFREEYVDRTRPGARARPLDQPDRRLDLRLARRRHRQVQRVEERLPLDRARAGPLPLLPLAGRDAGPPVLRLPGRPGRHPGGGGPALHLRGARGRRRGPRAARRGSGPAQGAGPLRWS